jgi:cytochrome P450
MLFERAPTRNQSIDRRETMATVERDYFTDLSVLKDPYEYFEDLYSKGPVYRLQDRDIVVVTGFEESVEVLRNTRDFSSIVSTGGPALPLPFEPQGDDISAQTEANRSKFPSADLLVTYDDAPHAASRSLLNRLFTPSRLKANEDFMNSYADRLVKEMVAKGRCELIREVAAPYVTLVVADLLGVPEDDRETFRRVIDEAPPPGAMVEGGSAVQPLVFMAGYFVRYIQDRRAHPRKDILTEFSNATYPDGSTPDIMELVRLATFLFGAGQDTSAKLIGNSMRFLVEAPGLQQQLREDRSLIPAFLEEVLRLEGSTKMTSRLVRRKTRIGAMEVAAGTKVMIAFGGANRDPRRWEEPKEFKLKRPKIAEHVAFGRGAHTCIGAPLARAEVRILLDRLLENTSEIQLSENHHGPAGRRRLDYEPSFIIRGLENMHLELKPA